MLRVDAHHHVWTLARGDYRWLSPGLPIARDYGLDDLRPLLGDIAATVLVQAADTEAETEFLLEVARGSAGLVQGVVGWTDLAAPGAPDRIAGLARDPLLKGLRPMLQDIEDTAWILLPAVQPALAAMARHGLRFDALIKPRHLALVGGLAQRHPELRVVIDHAASRTSPAAASTPGRATWRGSPAKRRGVASCRASSPRRGPTGGSTISAPVSSTCWRRSGRTG